MQRAAEPSPVGKQPRPAKGERVKTLNDWQTALHRYLSDRIGQELSAGDLFSQLAPLCRFMTRRAPGLQNGKLGTTPHEVMRWGAFSAALRILNVRFEPPVSRGAPLQKATTVIAEAAGKQQRAKQAKRKAKEPRYPGAKGKAQVANAKVGNAQVKVEGANDVALDPERDIAAETEALARLAACDFGLFIDRVQVDAGFIFESDAVKALIKLREKSRADFARLRARLEKEAKFRRFAALEAAMRAEAGTNEANGDGLPGRPITFDQIEPWATPVDGEELLTELSDHDRRLRHHGDKHQRDAAALWAAHAHAHDFRDTSPPLVIKSPTMRSGKTKLVEVLERLVPRPLFVSGITVSFLERAIEAHHPTLSLTNMTR